MTLDRPDRDDEPKRLPRKMPHDKSLLNDRGEPDREEFKWSNDCLEHATKQELSILTKCKEMWTKAPPLAPLLFEAIVEPFLKEFRRRYDEYDVEQGPDAAPQDPLVLLREALAKTDPAIAHIICEKLRENGVDVD